MTQSATGYRFHVLPRVRTLTAMLAFVDVLLGKCTYGGAWTLAAEHVNCALHLDSCAILPSGGFSPNTNGPNGPSKRPTRLLFGCMVTGMLGPGMGCALACRGQQQVV